MPRLEPGPPADECYQGICRLVWRRPRSAASGPGPEPMRTPSSIMAMMLSPFIPLRNATPAFFVASKTARPRVHEDLRHLGALDVVRHRHVARAPLGEPDARHRHALLRVSRARAGPRSSGRPGSRRWDSAATGRRAAGTPGSTRPRCAPRSPGRRCRGAPRRSPRSPARADSATTARGCGPPPACARARAARRGRRSRAPADHPVVAPHHLLVDAAQRQHGDDGGRAVAALGRPAVDEPLHEAAQGVHVEGAVLHVVGDVVGPGLRQAHALLVAAPVHLRVVDRLVRSNSSITLWIRFGA